MTAGSRAASSVGFAASPSGGHDVDVSNVDRAVSVLLRGFGLGQALERARRLESLASSQAFAQMVTQRLEEMAAMQGERRR